ncbi:hypothetical protein OE88DRAFT_1651398 [Heliocybe sulcata]|uniref:Uncharacterized protein n=1 Tax=Heliocybe sulcata TaxID=5364 RepID=A0A5C3NN35_9AGAM|nr:hypothetical protein OE88DRAFT_1651398 [Heliocybe sulcata]
MQSPRPILKRSAVTYPIDTSAATLASGTKHPSPRSALPTTLSVHFPPSSGLTKTFDTHSAAVYDRSPIVVSRNQCALPERGCPGRTYGLEAAEEERGRSRRVKDDKRTTNAHSGCTSSSPPGVLPPLIPDQSESDDSDSSSSSGHSSFVSTSASSLPQSIPVKPSAYDLHSNSPNLAFLPHPRGRSRTRPQHEEQNHPRRPRASKAFSQDVFGSDHGCLAGF